MSEAKGTRPVERGDDQSPVPGSTEPATGGAADGRSAESAPSTVVAVRMSPEDLEVLDGLREQLGGSRSDALRSAVQAVGDAFASGSVSRVEDQLARKVAARRPVVIQAGDEAMAEVRDALLAVADGYAARAREVNYIGHNLNQLLKLAHSGIDLDNDSLKSITRALEEIRLVMISDAERDAEALEVLSCLSS
ncbi:hypothetical protein ACF046_03090 [Glutamicibacter creatinolyticus]|uniref:hypothetical protein n=1 Tax=Glutamicibacter creatinolyticus TaxID=162496 RepID=UPI0033E99B8B